MTPVGTPKTLKNKETHEQILFGFGGRFLARRSAVEERGLEGFAAEGGLSGGGGGFASQLCPDYPKIMCACHVLVQLTWLVRPLFVVVLVGIARLKHPADLQAHSASTRLSNLQCTDRCDVPASFTPFVKASGIPQQAPNRRSSGKYLTYLFCFPLSVHFFHLLSEILLVLFQIKWVR